MAKPKKSAVSAARKPIPRSKDISALQQDVRDWQNTAEVTSRELNRERKWSAELVHENDALLLRIAELEAMTPIPGKLWRRGKLPDGRLIKTSSQTGEIVEIDRDEWEFLT